LSGLNEGDKVIVGNVGILGRGMQVTVLGTDDQSPGSRRGGKKGAGGGGGRGRAAQVPTP